jgi:F0F1-type ATP synthase membrane subunit b/b'
VWRYLKAAFLVGVEVPALGRVPLNALAAAGLFILGFGHPGFWFLGLAAEAAIVPALAFNKRFQNVVDAQDQEISDDDSQAKRASLVQLLPADYKKRLADLQRKCEKVIEVYRNAQAEEFLIDTNRGALENLKWVYLKLLIARFHLLTAGTDDTPESLSRKIDSLQKDLQNAQETPALRQSRAATLDILKRRLLNIERRGQSLEEVESDLTRVESQVDLILDNAAMQGKPQTISTDIELASDLVTGGMFGDVESTVADLDRDYGKSRSLGKTAAPEHS